ncbi:MAG TPA: ribonuclease HII [Cyanobacteria bacterium UBA9971]|nr:ribonuclease HII [Cyanobacteria bacterium UBA9971]
MKILRQSKIEELVAFDCKHGSIVIGTDEAGRGPLAGPVVAGAVYFPELNQEVCEVVKFIDDSKKFSSNPKLRKELSESIKSVAKYSIQECSVEEIDKINILQASLLAMRKSCEELIGQLNLSCHSEGFSPKNLSNLDFKPNSPNGQILRTAQDDKEIHSNLIILVDGNFVIPQYNYKQKAVKKGDTLSASIAAASILAKVHRDELMQGLAENFPQYGWHKNKGYGTQEHREAILTHGACKCHRKTFLNKVLCEQKKLF